MQSLAKSKGTQKWFHETQVQKRMAMLPWDLGPVLSSQCCQFAGMMGLCGPVHANRGWYTNASAPLPAAPRWKPCSHHLTGALSPIIEVHLGTKCRSGGYMVNITQNKLDDLKRVIKVCPFFSIPKGLPTLYCCWEVPWVVWYLWNH